MSVDAAADRALELHTAGATAEGVALLRSSVARAPRHFETRFRLGSLLHVSGDLDGAVASYAAAIALDAGVAVAHVNMGEAQRIRGDLGAAEIALSAALRLGHESAAVLNSLGLVYHYSRGRGAEARATFERALALEPENAEVLFNLGVAHKHAGRTSDAERAFRATLAHAPGYASASLNLAALFHENGQLAEAVKHYERTLAIPRVTIETRRMATTNTGVALMQLGRVRDAVERFEVSVLVCTVTFHANHAHNLTRSP
jgi:tetratricopeptide (TPR) repeat protein